MRRSEMVKLLADALEYHDWKGEPDEMADLILRLLESQGMRPPPYTFKHEVVNPDTVNTISVTNYEWENEECNPHLPHSEYAINAGTQRKKNGMKLKSGQW